MTYSVGAPPVVGALHVSVTEEPVEEGVNAPGAPGGPMPPAVPAPPLIVQLRVACSTEAGSERTNVVASRATACRVCVPVGIEAAAAASVFPVPTATPSRSHVTPIEC